MVFPQANIPAHIAEKHAAAKNSVAAKQTELDAQKALLENELRILQNHSTLRQGLVMVEEDAKRRAHTINHFVSPEEFEKSMRSAASGVESHRIIEALGAAAAIEFGLRHKEDLLKMIPDWLVHPIRDKLKKFETENEAVLRKHGALE